VSFIKIDVEGHELEVLKGGSLLLERERPSLLVEIEQRHLLQPIGVVFDYLQSRGYGGFFLEQRRLRPISEFSVAHHQDVSRVYTEDYINNFVFVTDQRLLSFK